MTTSDISSAPGRPVPAFDAIAAAAVGGLRGDCTENHAAVGPRVYGEDRDGLVLCRSCRAPLFYCDLGGSG